MPEKVTIITGASSGIGAAVARRLAREGMRLGLIARREDRLQEVAAAVVAAGGQALVLPGDVRDRAAVAASVSSVLNRWQRLDVLLNNAGLGHGARVLNLDPQHVREQVDVNLVAVIEFAQAVLPAMMAQRSGHIINVASIAGLVGLPGSSVYSATKYGVVGFSEGLRREVRRYDIHVTAFCPGFIATEFSRDLQAVAEGRPAARWLPGVMRVDYAADYIARLIRHPRRCAIIPPGWSLLVAFARTYPFIADLILGWADRRGLTNSR
jgi:short-subunit dehydrogenase